jgi:hypothetical protein
VTDGTGEEVGIWIQKALNATPEYLQFILHKEGRMNIFCSTEYYGNINSLE